MLRVSWPVRMPAPYGLGVLTSALFTLAALGLCAGLRPLVPGHLAAPLLLLPVVLSARYGGLGPALLAALLSVVSLMYFFEAPLHTFALDFADGLRLVTFVFTAVLIAALNSRRQRAEASLRATEIELRVARTIQHRLFPSSALSLEGVEVFGSSLPAAATGGDYFDFVPMQRGAVGIVVGDVSGHGLGPAILMSETRAYLRALALTCDDPGEIMTRLNRLLTDDIRDEGFCTLFFARLDCRAASLIYTAAGHEGYLVEPSGKISRLPSTAPPLGIEGRLIVPCAAPVRLQPGQIFVLATDGLSDACAPDGNRFGTARLQDIVRANRDKDARGIHDCLSEAVRDFSAQAAQPDDITLVVLKVVG